MDSILLISNTNEFLATVSNLLQQSSPAGLFTAKNTTEAKRYLIDSFFDLIIIDSPLQNNDTTEIALFASEYTTAGIIVTAKDGVVNDKTTTLENAGIFIIQKPIDSTFFTQAIKLLTASRKRVAKLESENQKLHNRIQEIRLIDRAKHILIQYLNMTESQAHRYIEKQSMDLRQSKSSIAENILKTYER